MAPVVPTKETSMRSLGAPSIFVVTCAPFILFATPYAQALDVKPGLWEVTVAGTDSVTKVCYTADVLNSDMSQIPPTPGIQCKNEIEQSTGKLVVTRTVCTGTMSIDGETRVEVVDPEAMSMHSTSVMNLGGNKQTLDVVANYKWLRTDCGEVKPFDPKNPLH
jgi:hypothetical protein